MQGSNQGRKLELELVAVDFTLERWWADAAVARKALASLSGADLEEQLTAIFPL